jgi:lysophospholipase L1-like esterase
MTFWIVVAGVAAPALLIGAELGCRWWIRRRTHYHVWPPGMRLEVRQDPAIFPEVEPRVHFDINADGERGGEVGGGQDGVYRILVAGGSSVECYALDQPTSWPGALERLLNAPDMLHALGARRVHVGNIGHSGVGAADLDLILERVLPQYGRVDAIAIMVGASTVYHWLEDGAPPSSPPSVVPEFVLFACHPGQPFGWTPRACALAEAARRLRRRWLHPVEVKERAGAWLVDGRRMRAAAKEIRTTVPDPATVLDHFEHHFRRALNRAAAYADRVLVVRQPWFEKEYTPEEAARFWHGGVGRPWKEPVSVYFSLEIINRLLGFVDARAVRVADALGVQHVSLRTLLSQGLHHYYDHDHFTPDGAAVVARAVAAALLRQARPGRPSPAPVASSAPVGAAD